MGPTPILEMARAYGLRPRLWLLHWANAGVMTINDLMKSDSRIIYLTAVSKIRAMRSLKIVTAR